MKEYIEREAVLIYAKMLVHTAYERKEKITDEEIEKLVYGIHADFTGAELGSIPAADVRPVVLCRDCDCWNVWDRVRDTCSCGFWSEDRLIYTKEKDFCSWGRKRGVDE